MPHTEFLVKMSIKIIFDPQIAGQAPITVRKTHHVLFKDQITKQSGLLVC